MDLELDGVTWTGPAADADADHRRVLAELPPDLRNVLGAVNGFILRGGALHVRGVVSSPSWHSLEAAWRGEEAVARLYPGVREDDIPFGQDCVGDQFLLRQGAVLRLAAETGDIETVSASLPELLAAASRDPVEALQAEPLLEFLAHGGTLAPGRCLHVYPPFCTAESAQGVSLRDIPADELLRAHADFAAQIRARPPGSPIKVTVVD